MGGLDVQTTIGFGNYDELKRENTRVRSRLKPLKLDCKTTLVLFLRVY